MRDDELDRILSTEREIVPSPNFVVSVMEAVQREATTLPTAFPWMLALPGFCAAGLTLVALTVMSVQMLSGGAAPQILPRALPSVPSAALEACKNAGAPWIVLALILSFASVRISMRFTSSQD